MREASRADIPAIARWMKRDFGKAEDFTGFFDKPGNICLTEGEGGAFFVPTEPGVYEVHVAFEQRGKAVFELSHRMLDYMRQRHGATRFLSCIPEGERKVLMFTRLMGWKPLGHANGYEIFQSE